MGKNTWKGKYKMKVIQMSNVELIEERDLINATPDHEVHPFEDWQFKWDTVDKEFKDRLTKIGFI